MDPQALLTQIYTRNRGEPEGPPVPLNLEDPTQVDWGRLTRELQLTPEEVQELQIPAPEGGPTLAERVQRLRPQANIGALNLSIEDEKLQGRVRF